MSFNQTLFFMTVEFIYINTLMIYYYTWYYEKHLEQFEDPVFKLLFRVRRALVWSDFVTKSEEIVHFFLLYYLQHWIHRYRGTAEIYHLFLHSVLMNIVILGKKILLHYYIDNYRLCCVMENTEIWLADTRNKVTFMFA